MYYLFPTTTFKLDLTLPRRNPSITSQISMKELLRGDSKGQLISSLPQTSNWAPNAPLIRIVISSLSQEKKEGNKEKGHQYPIDLLFFKLILIS